MAKHFITNEDGYQTLCCTLTRAVAVNLQEIVCNATTFMYDKVSETRD